MTASFVTYQQKVSESIGDHRAAYACLSQPALRNRAPVPGCLTDAPRRLVRSPAVAPKRSIAGWGRRLFGQLDSCTKIEATAGPFVLRSVRAELLTSSGPGSVPRQAAGGLT
jgi:hypothetical protein